MAYQVYQWDTYITHRNGAETKIDGTRAESWGWRAFEQACADYPDAAKVTLTRGVVHPRLGVTDITPIFIHYPKQEGSPNA